MVNVRVVDHNGLSQLNDICYYYYNLALVFVGLRAVCLLSVCLYVCTYVFMSVCMYVYSNVDIIILYSIGTEETFVARTKLTGHETRTVSPSSSS